MFKNIFNKAIFNGYKRFKSSVSNSQKIRIAICGAAGNVGEIVSFCMKKSKYNLELSLFDKSMGLKRLTDQLSLINTTISVEGHTGPLRLKSALKDADIVAVIVKHKSSNALAATSDKFEHNFPLVANIAKCCMEICPEAILAIATNPLNAIIPAISGLYKCYGFQYDHKIIGITSMDVLTARFVYAEHFKRNPNDVLIPIIGGTTTDTMVPIFSEAAFLRNVGDVIPELNANECEALQLQFVTLKNITNTSELPTAYAISKLLESITKALLGEKDIIETAYVAAPEDSPARYMVSLLDLNEQGIDTVYGPPRNVNRYEKKLLYPAILNLERDIKHGEQYVQALQKAALTQSK